MFSYVCESVFVLGWCGAPVVSHPPSTQKQRDCMEGTASLLSHVATVTKTASKGVMLFDNTAFKGILQYFVNVLHKDKSENALRNIVRNDSY